MESREQKQSSLQLLREQLDSGAMRSARVMVHSLHPAEVARLLESLPQRERAVLWEMISSDDEGDVLVEVSDEVRDGLIKGMDTEQVLAAHPVVTAASVHGFQPWATARAGAFSSPCSSIRRRADGVAKGSWLACSP